MAEDEPIVIDTAIFHERWKEMNNMALPSTYIDKIEELKSRYACFRVKTHHPKHSQKTGKYAYKEPAETNEFPAVRHMRPRIGALFTNMEGKARKNFTSFMNKLSPQNKSDILPNFIKSLVPENIHIYMDQIIRLFQVQPTYHDLYMEVLHEIMTLAPEKAKELLEESFVQFIDEEKYKIPKSILENLDVLDTSSEQKDQLCEYVQWKKRTKALVTFYINCVANGLYGSEEDIEKVFIHVGDMVDKYWNESAVVDIYLDIAQHGLESLETYYSRGFFVFDIIMSRYYAWKNQKDTLKPSSKFKVLDIHDIIQKNVPKG